MDCRTRAHGDKPAAQLRDQPLSDSVRYHPDTKSKWFPQFSRRPRIDIYIPGRNNPVMSRPEAIRRVKTYSAASGYVYQYYFYEVQKARRGFTAGTEYVYMVSRDRSKVFP